MLCLGYKEKRGKFPDRKQLLGNHNGHDIEYLKNEVEKICIPVERPFAQLDFELITSDALINRICRTLSEYGKNGRYFNLDSVLGKSQDFDAQHEWEQIENHVLKNHFGEQKLYSMLKGVTLDKLYETSNKILVIKLEQFIRALTRQFIFGTFSTESKQYISIIKNFSQLDDKDLGRTDYTNS
jgi:hypothetical protein